ncbi:jg8165 [Pararge aegeria aegeria]|uniref:Jg8165 protein n=1 Tax=Pararge aegeria aegeria TaxID=348720 RepID=A0A8S4SN66_9NEOP|nr:jg8165 [Pararge aegeria aegeria]
MSLAVTVNENIVTKTAGLGVLHYVPKGKYLKKKDDKRLLLYGGSNGGFLVCHLSGVYPDLYSLTVTRNPVTDLASMANTSDIADWCLSKTVGEETALMAYHAFVVSSLRYGLVIWGNSVDIQRLFIEQKKCIRTIVEPIR